MNDLLRDGIRDSPTAMLAIAGEWSFRQALWSRAASTPRTEPHRLSKQLAVLPWYPLLFVRFIDAFPAFREPATAAVHSPAHALAIIAARPSLYREFSPVIFQSLESVEQLALLAAREGYVQSLPRAGEVIDSWLVADPTRWLRAIRGLRPESEKLARDQAERAAEENRFCSPAWAYYWLCRESWREERPLDPQLTALLIADEEYCFSAALHLRNQGVPTPLWSVLESGIRTPRWSYHCLRTGLFSSTTRQTECVRVLESHPAWLVEWLTDHDTPFDTVKAHYERCSHVARQHELIERFHAWYDTIRIAVQVRAIG